MNTRCFLCSLWRMAFVVISLMASLGSKSAQAVNLIGGAGLHGIASSFRALEEEETPNLNGYGLQLQGGFIILNNLELTAITDYSQLEEGKFSLMGTSSQLWAAGMDVAARLGESAVFGISYQKGFLNSRFKEVEMSPNRSRWQGWLIGARLGGVISSSRDSEFLLALNYRKGTMRQKPSLALTTNTPTERTVDTFALGVTYLFKQQKRRGWW
ncbi:MAG: hypothetical protein ACOH5I_21275 [Oligoflexus sp.]